jgi:hypothetical protein
VTEQQVSLLGIGPRDAKSKVPSLRANAIVPGFDIMVEPAEWLVVPGSEKQRVACTGILRTLAGRNNVVYQDCLRLPVHACDAVRVLSQETGRMTLPGVAVPSLRSCTSAESLFPVTRPAGI